MELNTQTVSAIAEAKDMKQLVDAVNAQLTAIQKNFEAIKQAMDNDTPRSRAYTSGGQ